MDAFQPVVKILIYAIPILFAITVHEVAHGWVAEKFGDRTARQLGRITLNPFKHIDPIGTVLVPALLWWVGGFIFGWAKPVPITWHYLHHPKRDMAFVAIAGPFANLLMTLLWTVIAKITFYPPLMAMAGVGIMINLVLMVLNLLPIPPLDGSRVVASFLPDRLSFEYQKLEPYGFVILLILLVTGGLEAIIGPSIRWLVEWFYPMPNFLSL